MCPYCGAISGTELSAQQEICEHDLEEALRDSSEKSQGWGKERAAVKCRGCDAVSVFEVARVGQRCDFCGSTLLIALEDTGAVIVPESLLEFQVPEVRVRELLRQWYGSRWFAPGALAKGALTDVVRGIYIPYWTFDAKVDAQWWALSGYHYYETESYSDSEGRIQKRQVRKTRWEPTSGSLSHRFDDALVPGSKGVDAELLLKIEPFPTLTHLRPYDPGYLAGWVVEQYQVDLASAAQQSGERMREEVREMCAQRVPGDTHRSLEVDANFSEQTFKHVLMPVWIVTYTYGSVSYQVVVNGYTGAIGGRYPLSWAKIGVLVAVVLLALLMWYFSMETAGGSR